MGCLRRLGCLVVLLLCAAVAWFTRDRWMPIVREKLGGEPRATVVWEPLTDERAARARKALDRLSRPTGPVFANLTGGEAASYIFQALARQLPRSADSVEAAVLGDELALRASVALRDMGGQGVLGPLAGMLGDRERVQFGGTFTVVRPGLAEYRLRDIRVRDFSVPRALIPRLVQRMGRGGRPEGVAPDALPLEIPRWIADIRIAKGKITVYKSQGQ